MVFGYSGNWKEKHVGAKAFLLAGLIVAGFVGVSSYGWILSPTHTFMAYMGAYAGALCAGLLTLFFFWNGAGGFDKYVVDGLVNGVAYSSGFFGILMRKLQTGRVQTYIVFVLVGVMVLFFMFKS
jgi:hypothetical protein